MEALTLASLIALGMRIVSFLKFIRAKDWNSVATQAAAWVAGVVVVFIAAEADIVQNLKVAGFALADINDWSKVLLGMMFLSLGSTAYQLTKALDNSQSAEEPALVPPAKVITPEGDAVAPR